MNSKKQKVGNIIDLFAGCGGLSEGFKNNGFNVSVANECWKAAAETFKHANPKTMLVEERIENWTNVKIKNDLKKVGAKDIVGIVGGPPCQGFSMAGARKKNDPRNKLYKEYKRVVKFIKPKFFIMENVRGILSMEDIKGNKMIDNIIKDFNNLTPKYIVRYRVLNAADYGAPQERQRVVIIGIKKNGHDVLDCDVYPKPTHKPNEFKQLKAFVKRNGDLLNFTETDMKTVKLANSYNQIPTNIKKVLDKLKPYTAIETVLKDLEKYEDLDDSFNHMPMSHTRITIERMKKVPTWGNLPKDQSKWPKELRRKRFATVYKRLDKNRPACTMVPGHSAFPIHYKFHRSLTAREAARIQTLPDRMIFKGSKTEQCLVVGNAVPPLLSSAIAKKIKGLN